MKTCILVVFCLTFFSAVDSARDPVRQSTRRKVAIACIKETKAKYSTVMKYKNGDFSDQTAEAKCFLKCFGEKMGMFQSEDADNFCINEEFIHTYLEDIIVDKSKIPEIVDKCKAADRGMSRCDYSYNAYLCFYGETHHRPELYDQKESIFDAALSEQFKTEIDIELEEGDEELIESNAAIVT